MRRRWAGGRAGVIVIVEPVMCRGRPKSQIASQAIPYGQDGETEVQHRLGHEGAQRDRYGADGVQDERRGGDLAGAEHGGDEAKGAEQEQDGRRGQCDAQRAGPECRNGVGREVSEDEIDHELHADQRRQRERVQQVGDEAEGAGAAAEGEVEGGDEGQRQDLGDWGDQLGEGRGRDDLGALGGVDEQDDGAAAAGGCTDAIERRGDGMGHGFLRWVRSMVTAPAGGREGLVEQRFTDVGRWRSRSGGVDRPPRRSG